MTNMPRDASEIQRKLQLVSLTLHARVMHDCLKSKQNFRLRTESIKLCANNMIKKNTILVQFSRLGVQCTTSMIFGETL